MSVRIFFKLDDVKGESNEKNHKDEIDVLAWSWGVAQDGASHEIGGSKKRINVQDLSVTKRIDKSSPHLIAAACRGKHFKEALLTITNSGEGLVNYYKVTFNDLVISSFSAGGSAGNDLPVENMALKYTKFKVEYTPQRSDGKTDPVVEAEWSSSESKK